MIEAYIAIVLDVNLGLKFGYPIGDFCKEPLF